MMDRTEDLLQSIRCCRAGDRCDRCPLQPEICDVLFVKMISLPAEMVDRIEDTLAELDGRDGSR